jgi:bis(5'-adenosyl)-triphosphatase
MFGPWQIQPSQVFYESNLSLGIVNLKPLVPGHVLVIPKRVVARFADLTPNEVSDIYAQVHRISPVLERHYGCSAANIAMQDGSDAGQSVPHVHVHILPRKKDDFEKNDDVYEELEEIKLDESFRRPPRTQEAMKEEADELRALF